MTLDVKSEAGKVRGQVTTDLKTPDLAVRGEVDMERLNIAPIVKEPARKTDLTGHAKVDIKIPSQPAGVRVLDRLRGTFAFTGPHAAAEGYEARNVQVAGSLAGPRITLDAARGAAYGGDLHVARVHRDRLRRAARCRSSCKARRTTSTSGACRRSCGSRWRRRSRWRSITSAAPGPSISGTATLNESVVEGATLASGTAGEFRLTPGEVSYGARGTVANLDLDRIGGVFEVEAMAKPEYDSRFNGTFDVTGSVPRERPPAPRRAAGGHAAGDCPR